MTRTLDEKIVVFGFGAQGSAHALNLKDSKKDVSVCLKSQSRHIDEAKSSGIFLYTDVLEAAKNASIASILIPDTKQPAFYNEVLNDNLPKNAALIFAHGFAIQYKKIIPRKDLDVILVAPLAQGETVRSDFTAGGGVPCLVAIHQDATGRAKERALAYAKAISHTGPFVDSTFKEEVEIDLFAEQAVLCGGMPKLVEASIETLVNAGYKKDIAYYCCLKELRAIVNLMDKFGIAGMYERISDTALYGALTRGPRIINDETKNILGDILKEIQTGKFAKELEKGSSLAFSVLINPKR